MSSYIPEALRKQVFERAEARCEYCFIHQDNRLFAHEIDHIYAEKHGGDTRLDNLCLACSECNRYKGSDICSLDMDTNSIVELFHPRNDDWHTHFVLENGIIQSLTPQARVTVRMLRLNDFETLERRKILIEADRY
jgi:hypothetical protein